MYATWSFAVICDPQLGFGGLEHDVAAFELAVQRINDLPVDHVLVCGDLVNAPTEELFEKFNRIKAGFSMPCYCAPGNHDLTSIPVGRCSWIAFNGRRKHGQSDSRNGCAGAGIKLGDGFWTLSVH